MLAWRCSTNYVRVTLSAAGVEESDTVVRGLLCYWKARGLYSVQEANL